MRIIFVCTGNTCRSPMAEKIFKSMVDDKDIIVESRGVMCQEGMPMNLNAKVVMRERNLSTEHRSKALSLEDIKDADYIITMTQSHKMYIDSIFGENDKVRTMDDYAHNGDVIDPYGGDIFEYRRTARRLDLDLQKVKEKLIK